MNSGSFKLFHLHRYRVSFYCSSMMRKNIFNNRGRNMKFNNQFKPDLSDDAGGTRDSIPRNEYRNKLKCPPSLKGKQIGLWYRDMQKMKNEKQEKNEFISVSLSISKIEEIENAMSAVEALSARKEFDKNQDEHLEPLFLRNKRIPFEEKLDMMNKTEIKSVPSLDEEFFNEWKEKASNDKNYEAMMSFRKTLPSYEKKNEIIDLINNNQVVVISGETGCGKTTQIPQFILDDYIAKKQGSLFRAICTQPRRICAISVAERVSAERAETLGTSVGYQIRLESELPVRQSGSITFITTGVLLQRLQTNPTISGFSHVFVDEVHERDTLCDFLLTLLKYILPKRPDLKIILMSATMNHEKFSDYFGGVPKLEIPGFTYPVEEIYLEDILPKIPYKFFNSLNKSSKYRETTFRDYIVPYVNNLEQDHIISKSVAFELKSPNSEELNIDFIVEVIHYINKHEEDGAILVFVPGLSNIQSLNKILTSKKDLFSNTVIFPMHSLTQSSVGKLIFNEYPKGTRKIIISSSICETSITISDVRYVVDCGKTKFQNFDTVKNVSILEPEWETLANAKQRKGRAGRTRSGKCYKLFTRAREKIFDVFPTPDIQRCRLESVILKAKMLNVGRIGPFFERLMDSPDSKAVELSLEMLRTLNLLDTEERLTPLGYYVAKLPLEPQLGKMIVMGALFSCLDPILSIAACLNFKDPFKLILEKEELIQSKRHYFSSGEKSDHFMFSNVLMQWEETRYKTQFAYENFLSNGNLTFLNQMKSQLADYLYDMKFLASSDPKYFKSNINSRNASLIKAIVCSGLYPNVAKLKKVCKNKDTIWKTIDHPRIKFHQKSVLNKEFRSPLVVYFEKIKTAEVYLYDGTMVNPMALLIFAEKYNIIRNNEYIIEVDDIIKFSCTRKTAELIEKLKKHLAGILQQVLRNPKWLDWQKDDQTILLLKSIVELFTYEDKLNFSKSEECKMQRKTTPKYFFRS